MKLSKGALAALAVFLVLVVITSVSVWQTLSPPVEGRSATYSAEFDDATSLKGGDDVTLAGVRVGKVRSTGWERQDDGSVRAVVTFAIERHIELTENTRAEVKFADMLGVRYLGLTDPGGAPPVERGERLPILGKPPTDVTELFNGFRPVFRLLDPPRLNQLSASLIGALDGNTDVFQASLMGILDVSNVMLQRQAEIDRIANTLPDAFDVVIERRDDVEAAIEGLTTLTENLASRNEDIIALLDQGGSTMAKFATLLDTTMPDLRRTVQGAIAVSEEWSANTDEYARFLTALERGAEAVNHYGGYGSWLTLYFCTLTVEAGALNADPFAAVGATHTEVCR